MGTPDSPENGRPAKFAGNHAGDVQTGIRHADSSADGSQPVPPLEPLAGIDQLLPALLELNIRQARAGGQSDLAQALQSLQRQLQAREPLDRSE